jgi:hypothetical protein
MGEIVFNHPIGAPLPQAAPALIKSLSAIDHAITKAQLDVQHKSFSAAPVNASEIANLYNATVKDGRFIRKLASHPEQVAADLHLELSPAAASEIKKASLLAGAQLPGHPSGGIPAGSVSVVCVAVIVVLCADVGPNSRVILDRSGTIKL